MFRSRPSFITEGQARFFSHIRLFFLFAGSHGRTVGQAVVLSQSLVLKSKRINQPFLFSYLGGRCNTEPMHAPAAFFRRMLECFGFPSVQPQPPHAADCLLIASLDLRIEDLSEPVRKSCC